MPSISKNRRDSILNAESDNCALCGRGERKDDPWTIDHKLPKALGGKNARANLQKAHKFCNHLLGAKLHLAILEQERKDRHYPDVELEPEHINLISLGKGRVESDQ